MRPRLKKLTPATAALAVSATDLAGEIATWAAHRAPALRDDLRSEALLGACQAAQAYIPGGAATFPTFARHRIRGATRDFIRRERPGGFRRVDDAPASVPLDFDPVQPDDEDDDRAERFRAVLAAAETLPARHRWLIRCVYERGMSRLELRSAMRKHRDRLDEIHDEALAMIRERMGLEVAS